MIPLPLYPGGWVLDALAVLVIERWVFCLLGNMFYSILFNLLSKACGDGVMFWSGLVVVSIITMRSVETSWHSSSGLFCGCRRLYAPFTFISEMIF